MIADRSQTWRFWLLSLAFHPTLTPFCLTSPRAAGLKMPDKGSEESHGAIQEATMLPCRLKHFVRDPLTPHEFQIFLDFSSFCKILESSGVSPDFSGKIWRLMALDYFQNFPELSPRQGPDL